MMDMFSMIRENDLIWSFVVNNYLMGREPMPFDLLYWNADSTRLPATMLVYYLRKVYLENGLVRPGHLVLDGVPIDLRKIKTPCYFLATKDDHIAPWHSTYPATQVLRGPVRFVLGGSGHIAGKQIRLLDQRRGTARRRRLAGRRRTERWVVVDRLGPVAGQARRPQSPGARAGRRHAGAARGCPRLLCQGACRRIEPRATRCRRAERRSRANRSPSDSWRAAAPRRR
jgi:hypothetical protein